MLLAGRRRRDVIVTTPNEWSLIIRDRTRLKLDSLLAEESRYTWCGNSLEVLHRVLLYASPAMLMMFRMMAKINNVELYIAICLSVIGAIYSMSEWSKREALDRNRQVNTMLTYLSSKPDLTTLPDGFTEEVVTDNETASTSAAAAAPQPFPQSTNPTGPLPVSL
jgi:hypothetical protein